jgi:hypothetical protein
VFAEAEAIAKPAIEDFIDGKVDSVYHHLQRVQVGHAAEASWSSRCCRCPSETAEGSRERQTTI